MILSVSRGLFQMSSGKTTGPLVWMGTRCHRSSQRSMPQSAKMRRTSSVQYNVEVLLALLVVYNVLNGLVVSYLAGRLIGCNLWQQAVYVLGTPFYYLTKLRQKL